MGESSKVETPACQAHETNWAAAPSSDEETRGTISSGFSKIGDVRRPVLEERRSAGKMNRPGGRPGCGHSV